MFNCPHTAVALAALEKIVGARRDQAIGSRDRHLDRQRPEVLRVQDGVPHEHARGHDAAPRESAGRAAKRLRRRAARHRRRRRGITIEGQRNRGDRSRSARSKSGSSAEPRSPTSRRFERAVGSRHSGIRGRSSIVASALGGVTDLLLDGAAAATSGRSGDAGQGRGDLPAPPPGRRPRPDPRRPGQATAAGDDRRARRANTASSASRSACSGTSRHVRATCSSRAVSGCRRRSSPRR